jgi:ParB family chromosome partitioning protein
MDENTLKNKDLTLFIPLTELRDSPWQSRFEAITAQKGQPAKLQDIDELADSIEKNGMMQPIIVRPVDGGYEVIDGHRRIKAMRELRRGQILAIARVVSDKDAQIMHVVSNLQRKNLKPIELALTYQKMLDSRIFKDKRELSNAIGKDETYIGDLISTLQLDSRIIEDLAKNNLIKDLRMLRLIRMYDPVDENGISNPQWELYRKVLFSKMSRKELSVLLKKPVNNPPIKSWKMKQNQKKVTISLETGILDQVKKDKLMKLIAEKMQEISDSL